jgi:sec-independent protein translocase protein TatC
MTIDNPDENKMPLVEHLVELRKRLLISVVFFFVVFIGCYYVSKDLYAYLVRPLHDAMSEHGDTGQHMIYTNLTEAFWTNVRVAAFASAFLCFPIWAGQLWAFVAPGLYKREKKAFAPFLVATPVLFLAGAATVYYFVLPIACRFFLSFEQLAADTGPDGLPIELQAKVGEYLSLVMKFIFAFGIAYQMPVALSLLARVGILSSADLKAKRRYAIVGVFVAAAVLTPPDIFSQLSLAVPMLILYEVSILSCRWIERGRAKAAAEDTTDP